MLGGQRVDLHPCTTRATYEAGHYLEHLLETIGPYNDIDNIFLSGGGAYLYAPLMASAFKGREVRVQLEEPLFANVKGYQHLAERLLDR